MPAVNDDVLTVWKKCDTIDWYRKSHAKKKSILKYSKVKRIVENRGRYKARAETKAKTADKKSNVSIDSIFYRR